MGQWEWGWFIAPLVVFAYALGIYVGTFNSDYNQKCLEERRRYLEATERPKRVDRFTNGL